MGKPASPPASTARKDECSELIARDRRRSRPAKARDGTCSSRQPVMVSCSRSESAEKAEGSSVLTSSDDRHLVVGEEKSHINLFRFFNLRMRNFCVLKMERKIELCQFGFTLLLIQVKGDI